MQSMATNDHLFEPPRSKTYIPGHISPSHFQLPDMSDLGIQGVMAPAYQSLFAPGQEIPRLMNVTYRWWEDEATTVLWAFNIPEICTLIRYALFRDEELPRQALLSRNAETIDAFLVSLADTWEHRYLSNLSHLQRVEEVLRRLRIPPLREVHWSWFPPRHSVEPRNIAFAIELESHCQFMRMHFEDIVRAALGYSAPSVDWFLQQHTALYIHLLDHLTIYPEQIPTYIEAEKYLRSGSPFAYRAIVQCLHTLLPDAALNLRLPTKPGLEFITTPIQKLFLENPPKLTALLKKMCVLDVRFKQHYSQKSQMDWLTPFDPTALFMDDWLASTSPKDLSRTLVKTDEFKFKKLSRQNIINCDAMVKQLLENWHIMSMSVWEACCGVIGMVESLKECAEILFTKRDYYSLTAILEGIHRYSAGTARPRGLNGVHSGTVVLDNCVLEAIHLINPTHNYAAYRQHFAENPGTPFLFPHFRDYQQHGEMAIQPLLDYLQSTSSKVP